MLYKREAGKKFQSSQFIGALSWTCYRPLKQFDNAIEQSSGGQFRPCKVPKLEDLIMMRCHRKIQIQETQPRPCSWEKFEKPLQETTNLMQIKPVTVFTSQRSRNALAQLLELISRYRDASHAKMQIPTDPAYLETQLQFRTINRSAKGIAKCKQNGECKFNNCSVLHSKQVIHIQCKRM